MRPINIFTLMAVAGLFGLAISGAGHATLSSRVYTVPEIISAPSVYDTKIITVRGWISMRHEDYNLWDTWDDHEQWNVKQCISLKRYFKSDDQRKLVDGKLVLVTGRFYQDAARKNGQPVVRLGACNDFAIDFTDGGALKVLE